MTTQYHRTVIMNAGITIHLQSNVQLATTSIMPIITNRGERLNTSTQNPPWNHSFILRNTDREAVIIMTVPSVAQGFAKVIPAIPFLSPFILLGITIDLLAVEFLR